MKKRVIVQISSGQSGTPPYSHVFALCDDGTLWVKRAHFPLEFKWELVQPVPQGELISGDGEDES